MHRYTILFASDIWPHMACNTRLQAHRHRVAAQLIEEMNEMRSHCLTYVPSRHTGLRLDYDFMILIMDVVRDGTNSVPIQLVEATRMILHALDFQRPITVVNLTREAKMGLCWQDTIPVLFVNAAPYTEYGQTWKFICDFWGMFDREQMAERAAAEAAVTLEAPPPAEAPSDAASS
ncbi:hypothetical protein A3B32_00690 [Candidatus Uhrbacteria bacterium RIFCSPLOWO2_01_FULL_53_9]|uniref:Uncharacterized protein n=3 Tax=Candidatus Uhriibacteriota TaxID=1752732 RepID=A0A1F7UXD9_9BACT|nr:MAG: hypothetical protein A3B32_00690 [Candidatus Uhrbacteria bacterium RIFCSPLOWO2_01_FULL_53_9]OGL89671.1 MAG: hypothetical protein A3I45_01840 [Candidatus Uhrbacteria bacterium RIFCSPLOWO2_02_FULL_53_10]